MMKELLSGNIVSLSAGKSSSQGAEEPSPVKSNEPAGNAKSSEAVRNAEPSRATGLTANQKPKNVESSSAPGSNVSKADRDVAVAVEGSQNFLENWKAMPRTSTPLSKRPRYEDDEEFASEEEVSPYGE
jgi:hypothetical protein